MAPTVTIKVTNTLSIKSSVKKECNITHLLILTPVDLTLEFQTNGNSFGTP